ncbi:MAG: S9 family peptidase [Flavobacteriaceae bacterium]
MPNQKINAGTLQVPFATKIPKKLSQHGDVRVDNYFWLNQREDSLVLDYLQKENEYYQAKTQHQEAFQKELFREMRSRIKEDDETVPYKYNGYWYQTRFKNGLEYPIYIRWKDKNTVSEEIMFNGNEMAEGYEYFHLKGISVSPDNKMATFAVDTISRRQYTLFIKNLENGEIHTDKLENTTGTAVWAHDNKTIFYTAKDPQTLRANKIYRHKLGTPSTDDVMVYEESDDTYITFIYKSKSRKYIIIGSCSTLTSEYRILRSDEPEGEFEVFSPRTRGMEYSIFHYGHRFYILTNKDGATNFKLMTANEGQTTADHWQEFIGHNDDVLLEDVEIFEDFYVLSERKQGLNKLKIVRWDGTDSYYIPFQSETYVAGTYVNPDFESHTLRYVYNAMTNPYSIVDFNMDTKEQEVLKVQEVLGGGFDKNNYTSKRLWATATDGVQIPISLVYRNDTALDGTSPLLLYGYGAYGSTVDPHFSSVRLSLLDRGFIYAIAHVRGGEYLGRSWYEKGRLLFKKNTFTDFIDCSKHLIAEKYTSPAHHYAYGASAGGLLIGAVINMAPELYNGVIAVVPFVDVTTTMLDDTIPLTTGEYDEWGNPDEEEYYDYIMSYSPYDNVSSQDYPNMLVTTGLHDSQVQYWEPAKWVAKLREIKTDNNQLFLVTNMGTGHGGASGRFKALKETAKEYAFILNLEGKITQSKKKY